MTLIQVPKHRCFGSWRGHIWDKDMCGRCVLPIKSKAYLRSILGSDGSEGQNLSMRGRPPKTDLLFMSSQHIRAPLHSAKQHYEPMVHQDLVKQLSKRKMARPAVLDNGNAAFSEVSDNLRLGAALESCKGHQGFVPVGALRKDYELYVANFAGFSGQICLKDVGRQASKPDAACDCCDAKASQNQSSLYQPCKEDVVQSEQKPYLGRRVLAERFCPRLPKLSMRGELPAGDPRDLAGDCLRWGDRRMAGGGLMTISTEDVCSGDDRLGGGPVGGGLWAAKGGTSCATSCSISFCQPGTSFRHMRQHDLAQALNSAQSPAAALLDAGLSSFGHSDPTAG
ncbi:MAG: hypothetical protein FRX49_10491 [Trebouxia sp. A1-2]|nr:MAG: hypothetical protein FRX49_10491 [Trebouxia sp. A1-2]